MQAFTLIDLEYPMGENVLLWDEFEPNIIHIKNGVEERSRQRYPSYGFWHEENLRCSGHTFHV